ncbi:MAG: recombinase family protein [Clostridiaceae bacterium]|nr:recombinase family protein [Clostridiaceae bacterium]
MIAAIYSRKSIFTGKGDSIENQIILCKDYAKKYLLIDEFIIYEDEGYSGRNTNRPKFQELIMKIKSKQINVLICYRLDRISRNVADFSSTLELLQNNSVDFISIKEQFDTTTPMGRAMVYISSVFAQLERETTAERVKDNMLQLAKTGRWLGGQEPLGYLSERITYFDEELKERYLMKLTPINKELTVVSLIFNKYLEFHSINQVAKYLMLAGIKGKNGGDLATTQIRRLLSNPLYVKASDQIEKYLKTLGISVFGKPNGEGYLTYNKTKNITKDRDRTEWIAAIGKHPGIIEADRWLEVQKILSSNKNKKLPRLGTGDTKALLTGILKCSKCNSNMIIKQGHQSRTKENLRYDYYVCSSKESPYSDKCTNKNIRVDKLDHLVINEIKAYNKDLLINELTETIRNEVNDTDLKNRIDVINELVLEKEMSINNLVKQLSLNVNQQLSKYIFSEIENLNNEISNLKIELETTETSALINNKKIDNTDIILNCFTGFNEEFHRIYSIRLKRNLLKTVISKVFWDGENNILKILFINDKE